MVEYWYFAPLLYILVICTPLLFPNVLFTKEQSSRSKYEDFVVIFVNINQRSEGNNVYYSDKSVWVDAFLENEDHYDLEGVNDLKFFRNVEMDDADFEAFIFDLRDFEDHCCDQLNKQPFVVLNCYSVDYEAYLRDYGIKNIVNIKRLYGFHNKESAVVPSSSSMSLLGEVINDNEKFPTFIKILEEWVK